MSFSINLIIFYATEELNVPKVLLLGCVIVMYLDMVNIEYCFLYNKIAKEAEKRIQ